MIGYLWTRKQPIIALYFESENELKFYNLEARPDLIGVQTVSKTISVDRVMVFVVFGKVNY